MGVVRGIVHRGRESGRGYLNGAEVTAEKFVPDAWGGGRGERLYGTGDQVRNKSQGEIEYLGRKDEQVKIRGYRIELGEIEAVLLEREEVDQGVVAAREDRNGEKRLVAYVVAKADVDKQGLSARLREHAKEKLPEYMVPSAYGGSWRAAVDGEREAGPKALPEADRRKRREEGGIERPRTVEEEILWESGQRY